MKLLISDYDGTLNSDLKNLYLNIKAINKFRDNGNKFVIATGRSFYSIKKDIQRYDINYDYLICNDGLMIFDKDDNIINSSVMSQSDFDLVYTLLTSDSTVKKFELYNFYDSTCDLKNIVEFYVKFKSIKDVKFYKEYLKEIRENINCKTHFHSVFIGNKKNKADAIKDIQAIENINTEDIYTIGNDTNDLEMLKKYNGYKLISSYPRIWFKNIPSTREVHTLIKKIK